MIDNALDPFQTVQLCVVEDEADDELNDLPLTTDGNVDQVSSQSDESLPEYSPARTKTEKGEIQSVVHSYSDVFSEIPGCTSLVKYHIVLSSIEQIKT